MVFEKYAISRKIICERLLRSDPLFVRFIKNYPRYLFASMFAERSLKRLRSNSGDVEIESDDGKFKRTCPQVSTPEKILRCEARTTPRPQGKVLAPPTLVGKWKNLSKTPIISKDAENRDRFIPIRSWTDPSQCRYLMEIHEDEDSKCSSSDDERSQRALRDILMENPSKPLNRVLNFGDEGIKKSSSMTADDSSRIFSFDGRDESQDSSIERKRMRVISSDAVRILDAPDLIDDFYLNVLSWGSNNIIAIALHCSVYLWNAGTGDIQHLCASNDGIITSVQWVDRLNQTMFLAVGTQNGTVQLWDPSKRVLIRTFIGHMARASSLSWQNRNVISSGSQDSTIRSNDIRAGDSLTNVYIGHTMEVCGLKWNSDERTLASGGNDNKLCLWDSALSARQSPSMNQRFCPPRDIIQEHTAAVKALAWSPHERCVLASGGGTKDKRIMMWNSSNGKRIRSVETNSQVCALLWSTRTRELVSSHGFSDNQICIWNYPKLNTVKELFGHSKRTLHMALSPDGSTIVSAAADETLRFWDSFESAETHFSKNYSPLGCGISTSVFNMR